MIPRPVKGSFAWPGRQHLSVRDRILLEARSTGDLFRAFGMLDGDIESQVGDISYLILDWSWLHDPKWHGKFWSYHSAFLRDPTNSYSKQIKWQGRIPRTDAVSDVIAALLN
jgi:hypothetical protein